MSGAGGGDDDVTDHADGVAPRMRCFARSVSFGWRGERHPRALLRGDPVEDRVEMLVLDDYARHELRSNLVAEGVGA